MSLQAKLAEFLAEAQEEVDRLEQDRQRLVQAREDRIAEIRREATHAVDNCKTEYAAQLDAIQESLKKIARVEKALSDQPSGVSVRKAVQPTRVKQAMPETMERVSRGIRSFDGPFTVTDLRERLGMSGSTITTALNTMRSEGLVRPAGKRKRPADRPGRSAQQWALTPDGEEAIRDMQPELSAVA